jgi:antitoxin VapB
MDCRTRRSRAHLATGDIGIYYIVYYSKERSMHEAKLFMNGQSQAVRLPKAFRFEGNAVYIKRQGRGVLLLPKNLDPWDIALQSLSEFSDDLILERDQGKHQVRPALAPRVAEPRRSARPKRPR